MTFHGMINPDKETEKKKKILLDNILQYKRSQYTETRDALVHLNDKLQSCRQKTKVEADAIHSIKSRKKELLQKYIDSHVAIAYAKADIMIVEENKNSLFGTRENDHHFKRMGVEKTEKELEDALHRYRQSKQDFDDKRERIFSECVRVKDCSRQVAGFCRSIKDSVSWQIRNSTGESADRAGYENGDSGIESRSLRTRGGRKSVPAEIAEHVSVLRSSGHILAEKVIVARDGIQAEFSKYVKIHRGFESRPNTKHDTDVLAGRTITHSVTAVGSTGQDLDAFFDENTEFEDGRPRSGKDDFMPDSGAMTPDVGPPVLSVLPVSVANMASMQVRTARSRRSMRGKHIENMGIEKCGDDVVAHCADEGRLAHLKALRDGLETHVLFQEAVLLAARNILLNHDSTKTIIHADVATAPTAPDKLSETPVHLDGITITNPDEFASLQSLLSAVPSAPPRAAQSLIKLDKLDEFKIGNGVRKDSSRKRESGPLISDDTDADDEDKSKSYLGTGTKYAKDLKEATAVTLRESYQREAVLWTLLTSGSISLMQPPIPLPLKMNENADERHTHQIDEVALPRWATSSTLFGNGMDYCNDELYKTFLKSTLAQTSASVEKDAKDETFASNIPIELAATKLMVLNGANIKKF